MLDKQTAFAKITQLVERFDEQVDFLVYQLYYSTDELINIVEGEG